METSQPVSSSFFEVSLLGSLKTNHRSHGRPRYLTKKMDGGMIHKSAVDHDIRHSNTSIEPASEKDLGQKGSNSSSTLAADMPAGENSNFNHYISLISALINQSKRYPKAALIRGLTGKVVVEVLVTANGHIEKIAVSESSGFSALDEEALRSIKSLGQLPPFTFGAQQHTFEIPIRFELTQ